MKYNLKEVELSDGVVVRTTDLTDKQYNEILISDKKLKEFTVVLLLVSRRF